MTFSDIQDMAFSYLLENSETKTAPKINSIGRRFYDLSSCDLHIWEKVQRHITRPTYLRHRRHGNSRLFRLQHLTVCLVYLK